MMRLLQIAIAAVLCLVSPLSAWADYVEVRRNARIYAGPDRNSAELDAIDLDQESNTVVLEIVSSNLENGYYRVRLRSGSGTGWIYKSLVRRFAGAIPGGAASDVVAAGGGGVAPDAMVAHFIDVGQGHATLLEFSCGAVLIDTGGEGTDTVDGTRRLTEYLDGFFARRQDLNRRIDLLAITHPHIDHTRSIPALLDGDYTIRSAIDNGRWNGSGAAQQRRLQDSAAAENIVYRAIQEADITSPSGLTNSTIDPVKCQGTDPVIRALWGSLNEEDGWSSGTFENGNNHSVVMRVDFGESSFLFTGDLEADAIDDLVAFYEGSGTLDVDVYQVGHHGSHNATTEDLLRAMTPRIAVVPMGNSRASRAAYTAYSHGHPHFKAIDLLTAAGYGVSGLRAQPITAPVGIKGVCSSCDPKRPAAFENRTIAKAVYGTGWDGTVRITARANGEMAVQTGD